MLKSDGRLGGLAVFSVAQRLISLKSEKMLTAG